MTDTTQMGVTLIENGQNDKEDAMNLALNRIEDFLTESLTLDFTSADITLTSDQFRTAVQFDCENVSVARALTVPALAKLFVVSADSGNSADVTVTRGSTTEAVSAGETKIFYTDGTTNGLVVGSGSGGGGGIADPYADVLTESTTTRTLALTDANKYIRCTNASATTVTVAPQSSVTWADDTELYVYQAGAGQVTIAPGSVA